MKLTAAQIDTVRQATGFEPLPEAQAAESGLSRFFGDHTFYMDDAGVYVFEEVEIDGVEPAGEQPVTAVKIAALEPTGNANEVQVRSIAPLLTTTTVDVG